MKKIAPKKSEKSTRRGVLAISSDRLPEIQGGRGVIVNSPESERGVIVN